MTSRDKFDALEERTRRFIAADWKCVRCGQRPDRKGDVIQLAHRIRKGLVSKYGEAVVHHWLSAVPSCSTCNQNLLVHGEEERQLVTRIERIIAGEEEADTREGYSKLMEEFSHIQVSRSRGMGGYE